MPEIDAEFKWLPLQKATTLEELWRKAMLFGSAVMEVHWDKEPKMSTFKVGDRVRINWPNDDTGRFHGQVGVITKPHSSGQSWWVNLDTGHHDHWSPKSLTLISSKPQFKKGDKLRLIKSYGTHRQDKPWLFHFALPDDDAHVSFMYGDNGECNSSATHIFPVSSFELWDKQEKPMTDARKMQKAIADNKPYSLTNVARVYTDSDPLSYRAQKPVNCAICNKEYSGPEQVNGLYDGGTIVGGARYQSPLPKIKHNTITADCEIMQIGPCCARKVDAFIMDLKTKTNVTTTRENATNSWMPHDEDGNL